MDGVIVNSEVQWAKYEYQMLKNMWNAKVADTIMDDVLGSDVDSIYAMGNRLDNSVSKEQFLLGYDQLATKVYMQAEFTNGIDQVFDWLLVNELNIGLVSSSRKVWINMVLDRFEYADTFDYVESVNDRIDLKPKPYPDGYIEAMQIMGTSPIRTIIIEDSDKGIQAAKNSGAYTVGLKQNLPDEYEQQGADMCIEQIVDVIELFKES
jgi:beta-phosphoglucomutase-like phosphatase (HAD superfamily)